MANSGEDVIDLRDVITRFEEIEESEDAEDKSERTLLAELLAELNGKGGDEQWRGDWYPITLIRDSYFEEYAEQFADDIGAIDAKASWPNTHIDWKAAARDLQQDYSTVEYDGVTYWYR